MATMARIATPARHTNVLQHMAGHLKRLIDADSKRELQGAIDEYRRGLVPLVVPLTLLAPLRAAARRGVSRRPDLSRSRTRAS